MILVKNLNDTSGRVPAGFNSWIAYWEAKTGLKANVCNNVNCSAKNDLVGAHVIKVNSIDKNWYIVPLCKECNKKSDNFWVSGPLVPVNL